MEIWKDVVGYEGKYQVSNTGLVRSIVFINYNVRKERNKILKGRADNLGYIGLSLYENNKYKTKRIHTLVAQAFIPNPENKRTVNHKNGIKTDNRVENLEWMTHSENHKHAWNELGRVSYLKGVKSKDNWRSKKVKQINIQTGDVTIWDCMNDIHKHYGIVSGGRLSKCIVNKKKYRGCMREYII